MKKCFFLPQETTVKIYEQVEESPCKPNGIRIIRTTVQSGILIPNLLRVEIPFDILLVRFELKFGSKNSSIWTPVGFEIQF